MFRYTLRMQAKRLRRRPDSNCDERTSKHDDSEEPGGRAMGPCRSRRPGPRPRPASLGHAGRGPGPIAARDHNGNLNLKLLPLLRLSEYFKFCEFKLVSCL